MFHFSKFEDKFITMISKLKYGNRSTLPQYHKDLLEEVKKIKPEPKVLVPADKTSNYYKVDKFQYISMRGKAVHKDYKLAKANLEEKIAKDHKSLAKDLELEDRLEIAAKSESFITIKDHKNFWNNPSTGLINPCKQEIGIVSKKILDRIVQEVWTATQYNQWVSTTDVVKWFISIEGKK